MNDTYSTPQQLRRRRNSISTTMALTVLPHQNSSTTTTASSSSSSSSYSFPSDDLELLSIKSCSSPSYTSLKDLIPSVAVNSPKPNPALLLQPATDICIRNRLVKQAAWAYLQPKDTSPSSTGGSFFNRLIDLIRTTVVRILDWTLRFIPIRSFR